MANQQQEDMYQVFSGEAIVAKQIANDELADAKDVERDEYDSQTNYGSVDLFDQAENNRLYAELVESIDNGLRAMAIRAIELPSVLFSIIYDDEY